MQLYRSFGAPKLRPIKHRRAQGDHRGIQAEEFVLEAEFPLLLRRLLSHDLLALPQQLLEYGLVQLKADEKLPPLLPRGPNPSRSGKDTPEGRVVASGISEREQDYLDAQTWWAASPLHSRGLSVPIPDDRV